MLMLDLQCRVEMIGYYKEIIFVPGVETPITINLWSSYKYVIHLNIQVVLTLKLKTPFTQHILVIVSCEKDWK